MRFRSILLTICAMALLSPFHASAQTRDKPKDDPEVKLGRDGAAENEKEVKLITDPAIVERVNKIGQVIATVANEIMVPAHWGSSNVKKFIYTFKVVDDKDVNAYSLPGGFIYVHKGLIDYVHSDDELAGVLAHEVAHAAHHHMLKLLAEQRKMQIPGLLAVIGTAMISKDKADSTAKSLMAMQLYMTAKLNSYGIEAEKDADQAGMIYLTHTSYSPVGLLTFMERLARDETRGPEHELGIFRTHPPSPERAQSALAELEDLKIAVHRREVDPQAKALVATVMLNGAPVAQVKMYKTVIANLADTSDSKGADRAKSACDLINSLFDDGLQMYELRKSMDGTKLMARNVTLIAFKPEDAAANHSTVTQITADSLKAVQSLLWQDQFNKPVGRATNTK
ncbi:MAG: M48 family metalloprotease [Chthonomonadales bacterium]